MFQSDDLLFTEPWWLAAAALVACLCITSGLVSSKPLSRVFIWAGTVLCLACCIAVLVCGGRAGDALMYILLCTASLACAGAAEHKRNAGKGGDGNDGEGDK